RGLRGRLVPLGQRAQEEREITDRAERWLADKCSDGKSVVLRDFSRTLNLPKATAVAVVNNLIGRAKSRLAVSLTSSTSGTWKRCPPRADARSRYGSNRPDDDAEVVTDCRCVGENYREPRRTLPKWA